MQEVYKHLSSEERNSLHRGSLAGKSLRVIGKEIGRPAATLSRELERNGTTRDNYDAVLAIENAKGRRRCGSIKLTVDSPLTDYVFDRIQNGWSPQQISGWLKEGNEPTLPRVSHETIYQAIYIQPKGELRNTLVGCLRQSKKKRGFKAKSEGKTGVLKNSNTQAPHILCAVID